MAWNSPTDLRCVPHIVAVALVWLAISSSGVDAGDLWEAKPISLSPRNEIVKPRAIEDQWILEMESGYLWKVGNETPLDYELAPQIISVRGPRHFGGTAFGGKWFVRPQYSLLLEAFFEGPESYYLGFSASPVAEWWNADESFSVFAAVGGGFGMVDSQDVAGAQGQDFTLNWFAKSGMRFRIANEWYLSTAIFFQHMSNRGMTDPNPGLDALGGLIGISRPF